MYRIYSASLSLLLLFVLLPSRSYAAIPVVESEGTWTATKGVMFHYAINASNSPSSFSAAGLPAGLTLDSSLGQITGTPTTAGVYALKLGATNGSGAGTANLNLTVTADIAKGNDISELEQMAGSGFQFFDTDGKMRDPDQINNCLKILKERNVDLVRIRVMVPPIIAPNWDTELYGNCTIEQMVPLAVKAKALGFRILISLDYSWTLADPDDQRIPVGWVAQIANKPNEDPIKLLAADISAHTTDVLTKLKAAGVTPEFIALGNEITNGMLLTVDNDAKKDTPNGSPNYGKGANFAAFINAGYYAVKAVDPNIKVVLHCDLAHSDARNLGFFGNMKKYNGHWDVSSTDTSLADQYVPSISTTVNELAADFNTPGFGGDGVLMMEMEPPTVYPGGNYNPYINVNRTENFDFVTDILHLMRDIPNGKGLGTIYWDAQSDPDWRGYLQATWENEEPTSVLNAFVPSTLQTRGTNIVDGNGKSIELKGVNLGSWLVMQPGLSSSDSSGLPDEYSMMQKLDQRFGVPAEQTLMKAYRSSWITTQDLDKIKAQGLNVVRVPVWWGDLYTLDQLGAANPVIRADAFERLDWLTKAASERGLYTIIDLQGAFGGQSLSASTGQANQNQYWTNATDRANTQSLWSALATHCLGNPWVAGFDLLNEPTGVLDPSLGFTPTEANQLVVTQLNSLYHAVRAVDPYRLIFMEGAGGWDSLPNPSSYGWTNVVYEMHEAQTGNPTIAGVEAGADAQVKDFNLHKTYNVPAYIGDFNALAAGPVAWQYIVNAFNQNNIAWSSWSYKTSVSSSSKGSGLYTLAGNLPTIPSVTNDSLNTITSDWSKWSSTSFILNPTVALALIGPAALSSDPQATGKSGTPFTYQITANDSPTSFNATGLPAGLTVNFTTGLISGTPGNVSGPQGNVVTNVTISATTAGGTVSQNLRLKINGSVSGTLPPAFYSAAFATTTVGDIFAYTIEASNVDPSTIKLTSVLPPGLKLLSSKLIQGTPTVSGVYTIGFTVANGAGRANGSVVLTINPTPQKPVVTSSLAVAAPLNSPFDYGITTTDATTIFTATGLPPGLSMTINGVITGTPSKAGLYSIVISATNVAGTNTTTLNLTIGSAGTPSAPVISSSGLVTTTVNQPFSFAVVASNFPSAFSTTGLPSGLTINLLSGLISGTPTVPGSFTVGLSATNAGGTGTSNLILVVNNPTPVITSLSAATGAVGKPFSFTITASNTPTSFAAVNLPAGLSLNTTSGIISGTPAGTGTFVVSLRAKNASGFGAGILTLTVTLPGYDSWITSFGRGTFDTTPTAMPLHDGIPNILKFVFGINPTAFMTATDRFRLPRVGLEDTSDPSTNYLTLTFSQSQASNGLSIQVQISSDLQTWSTPVLTAGLPANSMQYREQPTGEKAPNGDPFMKIEVPVPVNVSKEFIRLRVPE